MVSANTNGGRIQREKKIIRIMVELYCRKKHGLKKELCGDCKTLLNYAHQRLEKCRFGNEKPVCSKCQVHCYRKDMRERVREVMRYAGPKMIMAHPLAAVAHFIHGIRKG